MPCRDPSAPRSMIICSRALMMQVWCSGLCWEKACCHKQSQPQLCYAQLWNLDHCLQDDLLPHTLDS